MSLKSFLFVGLETYIECIEKLFGKFHIRFGGLRIGPFEFELKQKANSSYQETIDKIEQTHQHLQDAISALGNLKSEI
jgi:hypothetical protein